jgi:periplasmic protein TonB
MDNSILMQCDLDDILFEHRNRTYGAYTLRKSYGRHIRTASFWGLAVFLLFIASPVIADKMKTRTWELKGPVVILPPPPMVEAKKVIPPPPPPPKQEPPKPIATIAFTPPKVTNREDIVEPELPKMEDITVAVSDKTQEGVHTDLPPMVEEVPPPPVEIPLKKDEPEDNSVHQLFGIQQQPEFKDGAAAMYQFLSKNIVYPNIARENGIEGIVYVSFVIWKDGAIRDAKVIRGIAGGCNEEALRVIRMMPNWNPGKQNGKAVAVAFTMPVKFKLEQ